MVKRNKASDAFEWVSTYGILFILLGMLILSFNYFVQKYATESILVANGPLMLIIGLVLLSLSYMRKK